MNEILSQGEGIAKFRSGEISYLPIDKEGDEYSVRYEHGWWVPYRPDGTRIRAGFIRSPDGTMREIVCGNERDILSWSVMSYDEAKALYPDMLHGLRP